MVFRICAFGVNAIAAFENDPRFSLDRRPPDGHHEASSQPRRRNNQEN
jgi:hypothetical protein